MGYCEEHDRVYRAAECPDCADDAGPTHDPATGRADDRRADAGEGDESSSAADAGNAADAVSEALDDALGDVEIDVDDADVVVGDQTKTTERTSRTRIDNSTRDVDRETTTRDERTTVEDSVLNRSEVEGASVEDSELNRSEVEDASVEGSTLNRSTVGGDAERNVRPGSDPDGEPASDERAATGRESPGERRSRSERGSTGEAGTEREASRSGDETQFCIHCGAELPAGLDHCTNCGDALQ
ncbi:hypothetical protein [Halosimplex marinum]|uniref:hypothetical protein n=1 Tax=Halosimplex marinum TaxID=3396620 RepID=UPI003F5728C7